MAVCEPGERAECFEPVPDGVRLVRMYRKLRGRGGEIADGQTCPECGGPVYYCSAGLVPDGLAERAEYQCLGCSRVENVPRECVECGQTTREYADPDAELDYPTCRDCSPEPEPVPDWVPMGGPDGMCEDCFRGSYDDVDVSRRQTWGIYPQDIRRVRRRPVYCDDCWAWRQERAPLKPSQDDIRQRRREVNGV